MDAASVGGLWVHLCRVLLTTAGLDGCGRPRLELLVAMEGPENFNAMFAAIADTLQLKRQRTNEATRLRMQKYRAKHAEAAAAEQQLADERERSREKSRLAKQEWRFQQKVLEKQEDFWDERDKVFAWTIACLVGDAVVDLTAQYEPITHIHTSKYTHTRRPQRLSVQGGPTTHTLRWGGGTPATTSPYTCPVAPRVPPSDSLGPPRNAPSCAGGRAVRAPHPTSDCAFAERAAFPDFADK